ncbi:AraC family transcriptional regulator [Tenacibaculum mesophilum]|uniref:AraC family transcriptional regulator n=1 Tax=Tenacibaculum mesophilum TaxID=104268 RepID=A0ABM7CDE4_9FLAO|nr:AraC family transcriptional regulator [Tenacibaculum mesophilum]AZJ31747.1 AraC family transcriptional regulator [Tenacibaculum mesophilum]QFS27001.1 helix-turn-helix domain-containing protein [Tenacibaculum mesophilum]SHG03838.1 Tetratricopeptide repeat-containing protein [Tenacibaculum mesophilum]
MKKIFVLLLVIGLSLKVYPQNHIKQDTLLRKSFQELSDLFYNSKPDSLKATIYAKKYFSKALKEKDTLEMLNGKYLLADILNNEDVYLTFCDSLIKIIENTSTKKISAIIHIDLATYFFHKEQNNRALKELMKANQIVHKLKDTYLKNKVLYLMGSIQNSVGENEKALKIYKKVYNYTLKEKLLTKDNFFSTIPLNITIEYRKLNKIDSALFYNRKAVSLYKKINDSINLGYSYYSLAFIYQKKQEHEKALKAYLKSLSAIQKDENYRILTNTYSKVAMLYDTIGFYSKSLKYHLKADSLFDVRKIPSRYLEDTYKYLINQYRDKDLKKQLLYIEKLLKIKDFKSSEKNKINKTFTEDYDIPNLISEKKKVIEKLQNEVKESRRNRIIYISFLVLSLALIGYQIKRKRSLKKRFIALVNQKEVTDKEKIKHVTKTTNKYELSDETINTIMKGLEVFEKNTDFLNSKINLQLLADRLDTNTSYLSKAINQYKKNSFSNYINQLRVKYTIEKLKKDSLWRKYTIKAISQEVGFKNAESFSKAFFKHTGLKPSYFIKELVKVKDHKSS